MAKLDRSNIGYGNIGLAPSSSPQPISGGVGQFSSPRSNVDDAPSTKDLKAQNAAYKKSEDERKAKELREAEIREIRVRYNEPEFQDVVDQLNSEQADSIDIYNAVAEKKLRARYDNDELNESELEGYLSALEGKKKYYEVEEEAYGSRRKTILDSVMEQAEANKGNSDTANTLLSAIPRMAGEYKMLGSLAAQALGSDRLSAQLESSARESEMETMKHPRRVESFSQAESAGDYLDWAWVTTLDMGIDMAATAAAGGVGGLVGKAVAKGAVKSALSKGAVSALGRRAFKKQLLAEISESVAKNEGKEALAKRILTTTGEAIDEKSALNLAEKLINEPITDKVKKDLAKGFLLDAELATSVGKGSIASGAAKTSAVAQNFARQGGESWSEITKAANEAGVAPDVTAAVTAAVSNTLLETWSGGQEISAVGDIMNKGVKDSVKRYITSGTFKNTAKRIGMEGVEEVSQGVTNAAAASYVIENWEQFKEKEFYVKRLDEFMGGIVGAGTMQGSRSSVAALYKKFKGGDKKAGVELEGIIKDQAVEAADKVEGIKLAKETLPPDAPVEFHEKIEPSEVPQFVGLKLTDNSTPYAEQIAKATTNEELDAVKEDFITNAQLEDSEVRVLEDYHADRVADFIKEPVAQETEPQKVPGEPTEKSEEVKEAPPKDEEVKEPQLVEEQDDGLDQTPLTKEESIKANEQIAQTYDPKVQENIAKLSESISKEDRAKARAEVEKSLPSMKDESKVTFKIDDSVESKIETWANEPVTGKENPTKRDVKKASLVSAYQLANIFGKPIVFLSNKSKTGKTLGGAYTEDGNIVVNTAAEGEYGYNIVSHELLHSLKQEHPEIYAEFAPQLEALVSEEDFKKESPNSHDFYTKVGANIKEELVANGMSDAMSKPEFVTDLAKRDPQLFGKVATVLLDLIKKIKKKITSTGSKAYISEIEQFESTLKDFLVKATRASQEKKTAIQKAKETISKKEKETKVEPKNTEVKKEPNRIEALKSKRDLLQKKIETRNKKAVTATRKKNAEKINAIDKAEIDRINDEIDSLQGSRFSVSKDVEGIEEGDQLDFEEEKMTFTEGVKSRARSYALKLAMGKLDSESGKIEIPAHMKASGLLGVRKIMRNFEENTQGNRMSVEEASNNLIKEVDSLHQKLEIKQAVSRMKPRERVRGADYIREKILNAKRKGDVSDEVADVAEWMVKKYDAQLDDLGISIRGNKQNSIATGSYTPLNRVITLFKGIEKDTTPIHEILHHFERMMPQEMQDEIRKEWIKAVMKARAKDPSHKKFFDLVLEADVLQHKGKLEEAMSLITGDRLYGKGPVKKEDRVPYSYYEFFNPSEFFAVRGTDLIKRRYDSKDSIFRKIATWMQEVLAKIKSVLGNKADAKILRAIDKIATSDGEFKSKEMLGRASSAYDIKGDELDVEPNIEEDSEVQDEIEAPEVALRDTISKIIDDGKFAKRAIDKMREFLSDPESKDLSALRAHMLTTQWLAKENKYVKDFKAASQERSNERADMIEDLFNRASAYIELDEKDRAETDEFFVKADEMNLDIHKNLDLNKNTKLNSRHIMIVAEDMGLVFSEEQAQGILAMRETLGHIKSEIQQQHKAEADEVREMARAYEKSFPSLRSELNSYQKTIDELTKKKDSNNGKLNTEEVSQFLEAEKGAFAFKELLENNRLAARKLRESAKGLDSKIAQLDGLKSYMPHLRDPGLHLVYRAEGGRINRQPVGKGKSGRAKMNKLKAELIKAKYNDRGADPDEKAKDAIYAKKGDPFFYEETVPENVESIFEDVKSGETLMMSKLAVEAAGLDSTSGTGKDVMEAMKYHFAARGFGRHMIKRGKGNSKGYKTKNLGGDVFLPYISGYAGSVTKAKVAKKYGLLLAKLPKAHETTRTFLTTSIKEELRNKGMIEKSIGFVKGTIYHYFLGLKASTALINTTQNYMSGVSNLAFEMGNKNVTTANMIKATKMMLSAQKGAIAYQLAARNGGKPKSVLGLTSEEVDLLNDIKAELKRGGMSAELGSRLKGSGKAKKVFNKYLKASSWMFEQSELSNRTTAFLAHYRKYKDKDAAMNFVEDTHYAYESWNQPVVFKGGMVNRSAGVVFGGLGTFAWNQWSMYMQQMTKTQRAKYLTSLAVAMTIIGGAPAADILDELYMWHFGQDLQEDLPTLGKVLHKGVLSTAMQELVGFAPDMSGSLALDIHPVFGLIKDTMIGEKKENPFSTVTSNLSEFIFGETKYGSPMSASDRLLKLTPLAIQNFFQGMGEIDGYKTSSGKMLANKKGEIQKANVVDGLLRALLSVNTMNRAEFKGRQWRGRAFGAYYSKMKSKLADDINSGDKPAYSRHSFNAEIKALKRKYGPDFFRTEELTEAYLKKRKKESRSY